MKLDRKYWHDDFKLNNISFNSKENLLEYVDNHVPKIASFLRAWFSSEQYIIVPTSGSTGTPKPIRLEKEQMRNSAIFTGEYFGLEHKTTALLCLPVAYIAGKMMLVRAITLGWHLDVIEADTNPLATNTTTYDFAAMVPLQLENSLINLHFIKKLIVGGGIVSNNLQLKLQGIATEVFATYGMTETITHIAVKRLNYFKTTSGTVKEFAIANNFYKTLKNTTIYSDERGCLVIKNSKISKDIIFTNDMVTLISDTQFKWLGRIDNVINSGGIKLHPEKIEEKLSYAISRRFFVFGLPDEKLGTKLVLVVEGEITKIKFVHLNLSKFEVPKEIYFVAQFVETTTKKIQRQKTIALLNF